MATPSSARGSARVRLIAIHTAEGSLTKESLGTYFAREGSQSSSHVGIDAGGIMDYVPYNRYSWTLRSGNPISDNAELCAFAEMTRAQWLSPTPVTFYSKAVKRSVTVRNPRQMLDHTRNWIRARCAARGIPLVKLSPADVAAGKAGVIGHIDWTNGMKDGSHTDPGPNFPWDYVLSPNPAPPQPEGLFMHLKPEQEDLIFRGVRDLYGVYDRDQAWLRVQFSALLQAVTADKDITPSEMQSMLDSAVAKSAASMAADVGERLRDEIADMVGDEMAGEIVNKIADRLTASAPTEGKTP